MRLRSLLLALSWLWLDALANTSSFYLTSLGSQCFLVFVGFAPCPACSVPCFAYAFLLYNFLDSSLVAFPFALFLHFRWHRVLCSCICFPLLVYLDTTSFSGLDEGLTSHTVREAVVGTLLGQNPALAKRWCLRALHRCLSDFAALP